MKVSMTGVFSLWNQDLRSQELFEETTSINSRFFLPILVDEPDSQAPFQMTA